MCICLSPWYRSPFAHFPHRTASMSACPPGPLPSLSHFWLLPCGPPPPSCAFYLVTSVYVGPCALYALWALTILSLLLSGPTGPSTLYPFLFFLLFFCLLLHTLSLSRCMVSSSNLFHTETIPLRSPTWQNLVSSPSLWGISYEVIYQVIIRSIITT
jgi:hypothetical protein